MSRSAWIDLGSANGVTLVRADYTGDLRQSRHAHAYTSITLLLNGRVEEQVGMRTSSGDGLNVVVKKAGVEHACRWGTDGARALSVEFDPAILAAAGPSPPAWAWSSREHAARSLLAFHTSWREGRLADDAGDLTVALLASIMEANACERQPPPWIAAACGALRDSAPVRVPTRELARLAGVHPVHFARVFQRFVGCSPTAYARWLRLRAAAAALVGARRSGIGRAGLRAGYYDHAHCCRELRRCLGLTPTQLRRIAQPVDPAGTPA